MTDYLEKYDLNLEYLQGNKHEEYKTALLEYYSTDNVCPKSGDEVKKELKDGILKIFCSKSKYNYSRSQYYVATASFYDCAS